MTLPNPSRLAPGKKALLIFTQGASQDTHADIMDKYAFFLQVSGMEVEKVRGVELGGETDLDVSAYAAEARQIAQKWAR